MKSKILLTKLLLQFIAIVFLCFISANVIAQVSWELAKEKNGIKVFTSKNGTSKYKSIKVEANLAGTMDKLMKVLLDASSNKSWVYATNESYLIKRLGPNEILSYTETVVPWPATNRDIPLKLQFIQDKKNNSLKVLVKGVPDAIPQKKGIVRIPYLNSSWDVKFDGKNRLNIVYFLEVDPGGSVPAWLVNMFVAKGPYETFNSLAGLIK